MSNAINNVISVPINLQVETAAVAAGPAARNATSAARPDPVAPADSDHTTLSPLGDLLNSAVHNASSLSAFRSDRVAELKGAIAAGAYHPDLGQVAQRVAQALKGGGQ